MMARDPNGTPSSEYDGSHLSIEVRSLVSPGVAGPANRDPTGDGHRDFYQKPSAGKKAK